jgi:hypothetical protein
MAAYITLLYIVMLFPYDKQSFTARDNELQELSYKHSGCFQKVSSYPLLSVTDISLDERQCQIYHLRL